MTSDKQRVSDALQKMFDIGQVGRAIDLINNLHAELIANDVWFDLLKRVTQPTREKLLKQLGRDRSVPTETLELYIKQQLDSDQFSPSFARRMSHLRNKRLSRCEKYSLDAYCTSRLYACGMRSAIHEIEQLPSYFWQESLRHFHPIVERWVHRLDEWLTEHQRYEDRTRDRAVAVRKRFQEILDRSFQ